MIVFIDSLDTIEELENRAKHSNLLRLVHQYRLNGHRLADLDPLLLQKLEYFMYKLVLYRN
jgi:2-oxoglutarate dehydrogenase complex dehydrogenase (E1) component-like enzyme